MLLTSVFNMFPIYYIEADFIIDTLDDIVFGRIQFWIKYHDTERPHIRNYLWFATQMCVVQFFDMLYLCWLWYWHCLSNCVRNDPVLDQIPWNMGKWYLQLHRSPNIIKYFLFVTHKCVLHVSDMLHLSWLWYWHSWSHCVRNDPVMDQIPWRMEKSYVQLQKVLT